MEGLALLEVATFDDVEHTMFSRRYFFPHACFKISVQLLVHKLEIAEVLILVHYQTISMASTFSNICLSSKRSSRVFDALTSGVLLLFSSTVKSSFQRLYNVCHFVFELHAAHRLSQKTFAHALYPLLPLCALPSLQKQPSYFLRNGAMCSPERSVLCSSNFWAGLVPILRCPLKPYKLGPISTLPTENRWKNQRVYARDLRPSKINDFGRWITQYHTES